MKKYIKALVFGICALCMAPLTLMYFLLSVVSNEDEVLASVSQLLSLLPGKAGSYLRAGFYRFSLTRCAADARISFGTLLSHTDTEISQGVYIGPQSNIGKCFIGEDCLLGSGVHVMSGKEQHNFNDLNTPIKEQGGNYVKVVIGKGCWVGNAALIMANVGEGSVIAAGAVVVNDIPPNVIAAGNPAKVIKTRDGTFSDNAK